jgi:hypothetical protein
MIGLSSRVVSSVEEGVGSAGSCQSWSLCIYSSRYACCILFNSGRISMQSLSSQNEPLSVSSEAKDVRFLSPIQERHFQFSQLCGNQPRVHPQARPITYHSSLFHHKLKQSRCSQLSEPLLGLLPDLSSHRPSYKSPSPWQSDSYLPVSPVPFPLSYNHP